MNLADKFKLAYQKLRSAERVLVVGHISPDADALSSIGAVIEIIKPHCPIVYAYASGKPVETYRFIPNEDMVSPDAPEDLESFDVIITLDCGSIARTGLEDRLRAMINDNNEGKLIRRPYLIEFDHHQPQETYADLEIRLPDKASTTEIIYHFLKENNLEITKELSNCILIGLVSDTGHFLHANSSREALAVSSEMLLCGASVPKIISHTVNNKSFDSLKIWGRVLDNMHFNEKTGLVSAGLSARDMDELMGSEAGAGLDLFGDIVSFLGRLSGVKVALLLREEEGRVKGSLRTNDDVIDVAAIAHGFGGGGHKKAAGFSLEGSLVKTANGWKVVKPE